MANYSGYTQKEYDNQSKYLNNLISQGGGNATWAKNELASLNSQYKPSASTPSTGSSYVSSGNTSTSNKYGTSTKYSNGNTYTSTDGGKTYTNSATGEVSKGNQGTSQYGQSSGWNSYTGATGKQYEVAGSNGTILVTQKDGSYRRVLPTDADYSATLNAMQKDLAGAGVSYTPSYTFGIDADLDGQKEYYTTKNYTAGNSALQDALAQYGKTNPGSSLNDYIYSIYNSIGTNGNTLQGAVDELTRLGLTDYLPGNAIYTASGKLIPGNQYTSFVNGSNNTTNSDDSRWVNYGGQSYLVGGDDSNYVNYVNALTGNYDMMDYIFGGANMANNPYAQQDPAFLAQFNNDLANIYAQSGALQSTPNTNGSYTGNVNVDNVINYGNSLGNYNQATGGSLGTINLLEMLQSYLNSGLEANQDFLSQQRALAEEQAQKQASDAYVNKVLAGDAMQQQLSALGLGTSGALQSAQMGIQGDYGNNLANIQQNLYTMLNGLSEQELAVLTDYYNNMANYAYDVTQYEADQAYRNAQLALQKQQMAYDEAYRKQQQLLQQQQWEFEQKKYEDALAQQEFENDLTLQELLGKKSSGSRSGSVSGDNAIIESVGDESIYGDVNSTGVTPLPATLSPLVTGLSAGTGLIDKLNEEEIKRLTDLSSDIDMSQLVLDATSQSGAINNGVTGGSVPYGDLLGALKGFNPTSYVNNLYTTNSANSGVRPLTEEEIAYYLSLAQM